MHWYFSRGEGQATLSLANMNGANLTSANLTHANLKGADLREAKFSTDTVLQDGQTVAEHGFDEAGLEEYLTQINSLPALDARDIIITTGLTGGYSSDGIVDAADYTVWKDNLGLDASALNGNGSGAATIVQDDYNIRMWPEKYRQHLQTLVTTVVQADYELWRTHFGQSSASGSGADHILEPTTVLLALLALVAMPLRVRCG
jgi:hypothetical protein